MIQTQRQQAECARWEAIFAKKHGAAEREYYANPAGDLPSREGLTCRILEQHGEVKLDRYTFGALRRKRRTKFPQSGYELGNL